MAHGPGAGLRASIRSADCDRFGSPRAITRRARLHDATPARPTDSGPALFLALCAKAPGPGHLARAPLVYSPPRAPFGRPPRQSSVFVPQGVACRCPRTSSPPLPGASSARSSAGRRRVHLRDLARAARAEVGPRRQRCSSTRRRPPTTGYPSASGASSRAAPGSRSGPTSRSSSPATAPSADSRPAAQAGGPRPRRHRAQPPLQLRAVHHRRRQPPRPCRLAGGRRASRARPTTRCSSTRRPASARRTCCTRSETTCFRSAAAPWSATRPSRRSRTTSSGRSGRARSTASSRPTATPTCC